MISIKTPAEIAIMKEGGTILSHVMDMLIAHAQKGIKLSDLDRLAEKEITRMGGEPSFKKVPDYRWSTCLCVNDIIVHGVPNEYQIREGDVVGIDCGVFYKGFHTDSSWSVLVPGGSEKIMKERTAFLDCGRQAFFEALQQVKSGNRIYDISHAIESRVEGAGYCVVHELIGHGVGRELHEDPEIPGFVKGKRERSPEIKQGMTFAVEVIYAMGGRQISISEDDKWTIRTKDGTLSGLFEATVAVASHGCIVLTKTYES